MSGAPQAAAFLRPPTLLRAWTQAETAIWGSKPSWYQVSSADRMIDPANEKRLAERMGARKIVTLSASHASLASMPAEVSAPINQAAKATSA